MKSALTAVACLIFAAFCAAQSAPQAQVMVLGVYHFDNPGRDLLNIRSEGIMTPAKQKEIEAVLDVLKKFHPTKIVIEAPVGSAKVQQQYADYLAGKYSLTANEIDQLGYRLAKELGHTRVYPVDVQFPFDFEEVAKFADAHQQSLIVNGAFEVAKQEVAKIQDHVDHGTVLETLRYMNDPTQVAKGHSFYMMLANVGAGEDYPGAKLLGEWYQRNVEIYGNIRKVIEKPEDHVLVVYGSGHLYWLERDVIDSGDLTLKQFGEIQ
jgi:hypothetical protein